jgi:hypothetical protein
MFALLKLMLAIVLKGMVYKTIRRKNAYSTK